MKHNNMRVNQMLPFTSLAILELIESNGQANKQEATQKQKWKSNWNANFQGNRNKIEAIVIAKIEIKILREGKGAK